MFDYDALIRSMFTYHPPTPEQAEAIQQLGESVKALAEEFERMAPGGPAKTLALRELHKFRMSANYCLVGGE